MRLTNIQVSGRLKDCPAAIFKVNQLVTKEVDQSIVLTSLNGKCSTHNSRANLPSFFVDVNGANAKQ